MVDDANHARLRRSMHGAFASRSLAEQESILDENIDLLLHQFEQQSKKGLETDLRLWYNYAKFNLIGDLAFRESSDFIASSTCHEWVQFVIDNFYVASLLQLVHRFRPLNKILAILLPPSLINKKETHSRIALEKIRRRVQKNTEKPDFISHMLKAIDTSLITIEELGKPSQHFHSCR
jgi:cytochrome P450